MVKSILVEDTRVGKSCLLMKFIENRFNEKHDMTIMSKWKFGFSKLMMICLLTCRSGTLLGKQASGLSPIQTIMKII
jgi:hypothetical protein